MDQVVLDCGDDPVAAGDVASLFGPGDDGEPTADDWAEAVGTINYEIVTRFGSTRVPRVYDGERRLDELRTQTRHGGPGSSARSSVVAAAGLAAGVAAERALVRRSQAPGRPVRRRAVRRPARSTRR